MPSFPPMLRRLLVIIGITVVLAGSLIVWLLWVAGEFRPLAPHFQGSCVQVKGILGAEDITIHPGSAVAYISAYDRRGVMAGEPGQGAIYAYDLRRRVPHLVNLTPAAAADFRPHGISLHVAKEGPDLLFVVNHAGGRHSIEIYAIGPGKLTHRETLHSDLLVSPNDLVAVDAERFYVTNDHGSAPGFMRTLEEYLRLSRSNVVYYDGTTFRQAASGIQFANGINMSETGDRIYVNALIGMTLNIYERNKASGALRLQKKIRLGTAGDNIERDSDGRLWIGAHPRLLTLTRHQQDPGLPAPSQVIRVSPDGDDAEVEEIFLDLGHRLSAASVAAVHGDRLLIGPIWDSRFLDCTLQPEGGE